MPVAIIVPIDAVDEIRVFKDTVVVESFGVDAQSFLLLEYLGQGLSQIGHLKPLSVGVRPPIHCHGFCLNYILGCDIQVYHSIVSTPLMYY